MRSTTILEGTVLEISLPRDNSITIETTQGSIEVCHLCDLDTNYGIMGFVKLLHLRDFYAKLGYTLCVEANW